MTVADGDSSLTVDWSAEAGSMAATRLQRACRMPVEAGSGRSLAPGDTSATRAAPEVRDPSVLSVTALARHLGTALAPIPYAIRVLLENLLRHAGRVEVGDALIERLARDPRGRAGKDTVAWWPARILSQDVSGIPSLIDLATMRDVLASQGGEPAHRHHAMFTMMVFLCVKCSSIASSEASLPRPEDFTPP